jgi:hypothetical protein
MRPTCSQPLNNDFELFHFLGRCSFLSSAFKCSLILVQTGNDAIGDGFFQPPQTARQVLHYKIAYQKSNKKHWNTTKIIRFFERVNNKS